MKLARFEPVPVGDDCIRVDRLEEFFRGSENWNEQEEKHLKECDWCWYMACWGVDECLSISQIVEFSFGRKPSKEEAVHLASCPMCAYDYVWALKEKEGEK